MTNKNIIKYIKIFILRFWNFNPKLSKTPKNSHRRYFERGGHDFVPKENRVVFSERGTFIAVPFQKD